MTKMNVNALKENFLHPIVPKMQGKPTRQRIEKIQKKICANATSIQTSLGGGAH